jgi:hypothetical protein
LAFACASAYGQFDPAYDPVDELVVAACGQVEAEFEPVDSASPVHYGLDCRPSSICCLLPWPLLFSVAVLLLLLDSVSSVSSMLHLWSLYVLLFLASLLLSWTCLMPRLLIGLYFLSAYVMLVLVLSVASVVLRVESALQHWLMRVGLMLLC